MIFKLLGIIGIYAIAGLFLVHNTYEREEEAKKIRENNEVILRISNSERNDKKLYSKEAWKDFVGEVLE